ncbi:MAG: DUF6514 family protein [Defluviitaleaceae bacterium]|nr:DUF6514 family protein [Defluviitaleaceae bacterium]
MRELIRRLEVPVSDKSMELSYYLLSQKSESAFLCEAVEGMIYGISVEADSLEVRGFYTYETALGFSYLKSEALDFINEIADAKVTPAGFLAVIDEYVENF